MQNRNTDYAQSVRSGVNKMINSIVLIMLILETASDIRTKSISAVRMIFFVVLAGAMNIIFCYQPVWSMLGGMAIGALLFAYALATSESIGYGDCLIFVCVGEFIGFSKNMQLLFFSLVAAAVSGGIYAIVRKKGMRAKIPFVPCILGTYTVMTITEIIKGGIVL